MSEQNEYVSAVFVVLFENDDNDNDVCAFVTVKLYNFVFVFFLLYQKNLKQFNVGIVSNLCNTRFFSRIKLFKHLPLTFDELQFDAKSYIEGIPCGKINITNIKRNSLILFKVGQVFL